MDRDVVETNSGASALLGSSGQPSGHGPGGGHLLAVDLGGTDLRCAIVSPEAPSSNTSASTRRSARPRQALKRMLDHLRCVLEADRFDRE
jgi:predicted NBD/HSP70 family sugar kinase